MRILFLIGLLISSFLPLSAQKIHGILVAATTDPVIGKGCQGDMAMMQRRLQHIANGIHYSLKLTIINRFEL